MKYFFLNLLSCGSILLILQLLGVCTDVGVLVGVLVGAWVGWVGWVDVGFLYGFAVGTDVGVLVGFIGGGKGGGGGRCRLRLGGPGSGVRRRGYLCHEEAFDWMAFFGSKSQLGLGRFAHRWFVRWLVRSLLVRSLLVRSLVRSLVHSLVRSLVRSSLVRLTAGPAALRDTAWL